MAFLQASLATLLNTRGSSAASALNGNAAGQAASASFLYSSQSITTSAGNTDPTYQAAAKRTKFSATREPGYVNKLAADPGNVDAVNTVDLVSATVTKP